MLVFSVRLPYLWLRVRLRSLDRVVCMLKSIVIRAPLVLLLGVKSIKSE